MRLSCMRLFKKHPEVIEKFQELTDMIGWLEPDERQVIYESADQWLQREMQPVVVLSKSIPTSIISGPNNSGMSRILQHEVTKLLWDQTKRKSGGDSEGRA